MKDCTEESIEVQVVIETKNLSSGSVRKLTDKIRMQAISEADEKQKEKSNSTNSFRCLLSLA